MIRLRQPSEEIVDIEREQAPSQIYSWMAARALHQADEVATLTRNCMRGDWKQTKLAGCSVKKSPVYSGY